MSDQTPADAYGQVPLRPQQRSGPPPPGYQYQPAGYGHGLATEIFSAAVLLAVSVWLGNQKTTD